MTDLDPRDRQLLDQLRAALDETDPVPGTVVDAAKASLTWLTVDAELAALAADSDLAATGVRSVGDSRVLTFECSTGVVVIEISQYDGMRRLVGHADRRADVVIRHRGGSLELTTDEHGRFSAQGVQAGPVSLHCAFHDAPDSPIVTSWVLV
jgi:hypothetical protein